jgi:methylmalonyl-CoA mutase N-terminal domain/subunit
MVEELSYDRARKRCTTDVVACNSTAELEPLQHIIGQDRAVKALQFGLKIKDNGFNIYVSGMPGTGRKTAVSGFLEEVAKFRAARRMWARMMREEFGAKDPKSWLLRFHTQTAGSALTAQQPENNVVRVAIQAMAAVVGGTQSLHTNAMDEAFSLPTEGAARVALRTQQVIGHESGLADVVDPLGGAWVVEAWTDRIEAEARAYIDRIEAMGGALAAIERGFQQREIHEAAYRTQRAIEAGEQVVVGVNRFRLEEEMAIPTFRVDPAVQREQIERLQAARARRDGASVAERLAALQEAARGRDNLMPPIVDAVEARATLGEIAYALAEVFGEHRERVAL